VKHPHFKVGDLVYVPFRQRFGRVDRIHENNGGFLPTIEVRIGSNEIVVIDFHGQGHSNGVRKIGLLEQIALAAAGKLPDDSKPW